jgi:protein CpxP
MLTKITLITGVILTVLIILAACRSKISHCWAHGDPEKRAKWICNKITSELDLDDAQKVQLNRIKEEILAKHREFKSESKQDEHVQRFLTEVTKDSLDRNFLLEVTDEKMRQLDEMRAFLVDKLVEFHAMLTPEQKEKLTEKITEFHETYHKE